MTHLTDEQRALGGGARTYSSSDFADFLRKRDMPQYNPNAIPITAGREER